LRLARFNANLGVVDKRFFQGLPSPAAAALVAGFVWLAVDNHFQIRDAWMPWATFGVTVYAGLSMVSSAPFYSGKNFHLGRSVPFWVMIVIVVGIYWLWRWWRGETNPARPSRAASPTPPKPG
jgi:CDP-diacylglycerol--serine O-phosphatidyltransferase